MALAGVGAYYMASLAYRATAGFLKYCILPRRNLKSRYGNGYALKVLFGEFSFSHALITGASDGLGKEYARNLAKSGFDVVLIARDKAKLDKVAEEIRQDYKVQTITIVYDFSKLATKDSIMEL